MTHKTFFVMSTHVLKPASATGLMRVSAPTSGL